MLQCQNSGASTYGNPKFRSLHHPYPIVKKYFLFFLLFITRTASAQTATDSLFVVPMADGWMLMEEVAAGENVSVLARRFFVPPAILASANAKSTDEPLRAGSTLFIPLAAYNLTRQPPARGQVDVRPLYYKVESDREQLSKIGRAGGVWERDLRDWNDLGDKDIEKGQTLIVGGLRYDATGTFGKRVTPPAIIVSGAQNGTNKVADTLLPAKKGSVTGLQDFIQRTDAILESDSRNSGASTATPLPVDTEVIPSIPKPARTRSAEATAFEELEAAGVGFVEERGTAVFFPSRSSNTLYAFHNVAGRGSVIKITNPLNGRAVYAKVLGPLPPTPQYNKAMLGLSSKAQKLLGIAGDARMWCEVAYVGY